MKKHSNHFLKALFLLLSLCFLFSCSNEPDENLVLTTVSKEFDQGSATITSPKDEYRYIEYSLQEFAGKTVSIDFSADMKVTNNTAEPVKLMWQVMHDPYPVVAQYEFQAGESDFITVKTDPKDEDVKNTNISLGNNEVLYLSTYGTDTSNIKIELKNVKYTVTYTDYVNPSAIDWMDSSVPSLYETYKDQFDYVGLACEYNSYLVKELVDNSVCAGLKKHANTITMGNEFKPDGFFGWGWSGNSSSLVDFKASNGKTIKVPSSLNYSTVDNCLSQCKKYGLKMRGHVLVWHSQTPDNFFAKDYVAKTNGELITNLVDKETMTARQEWYIKSVLEHVANWEKQNNDGKHIIWAWDVVNEAMADDAGSSYSGSGQNWLRGSTSGTSNKSPSNSGSRWYQIYESDEFIVNAFRFANAYAPSDVKLCYNDYNEYMNYSGGWKTNAICHLVDDIKAAAAQTINGKSVKPRIDAIGMQSHVGDSWPTINDYETAIKAFLNKGLNIHVTELDISTNDKSVAANTYENYFNLLQKYGNKSSSKNKIECVTLWGINNSTSWISNKSVAPLLFENFKTTKSFYSVINAHN